MLRDKITGYTFDQERALYGLKNADVENCRFEGPADGESALKEARSIEVNNCRFSLRYPLWHVRDFALAGVSMDDRARAAIWYAEDGRIENSQLGGIKALREYGSGWPWHSLLRKYAPILLYFGEKSRDFLRFWYVV